MLKNRTAEMACPCEVCNELQPWNVHSFWCLNLNFAWRQLNKDTIGEEVKWISLLYQETPAYNHDAQL